MTLVRRILSPDSMQETLASNKYHQCTQTILSSTSQPRNKLWTPENANPAGSSGDLPARSPSRGLQKESQPSPKSQDYRKTSNKATMSELWPTKENHRIHRRSSSIAATRPYKEHNLSFPAEEQNKITQSNQAVDNREMQLLLVHCYSTTFWLVSICPSVQLTGPPSEAPRLRAQQALKQRWGIPRSQSAADTRVLRTSGNLRDADSTRNFAKWQHTPGTHRLCTCLRPTWKRRNFHSSFIDLDTITSRR